MSVNAVTEVINRERKILVVDDEADLVDQITMYLSRHGFACEKAHSGNDALRIAKEDPDIAIVVTDVRMPGLDGLALAENLRAMYGDDRHLQVIIMTGYAGLDHAIRAVHMGAHDFLTKPVSLKQLLETVKGADKAVRTARLDDQYKVLLRNEVDERDQQMSRLRDRVQRLETDAAENRDAIVTDMREVIVPGMVEELLPAVELAHGMVALLAEEGAGIKSDEENHVLNHLRVAVDDALSGLQVSVDLMRVLSGDLEVAAERVRLDRVLTQAVAAARAETLGPAVAFSLPDEMDEVAVRADADWLQKAIQLLLGTAANLSPLGAVIRISIHSGGPSVGVRFDIDTRDLSSFGGDGHGEAAAMSPIHTSGLGYALVRRLMPLMGGALNFVQPAGSMSSFRMGLVAWKDDA